MTLPQDPNMLVSVINMKLRDGGYADLADLCASLGADPNAIEDKLRQAGFEYLPEARQFR